MNAFRFCSIQPKFSLESFYSLANFPRTPANAERKCNAMFEKAKEMIDGPCLALLLAAFERLAFSSKFCANILL